MNSLQVVLLVLTLPMVLVKCSQRSALRFVLFCFFPFSLEVEVEGGKRRERVNLMGVKCFRVTQIFPSTLKPHSYMLFAIIIHIHPSLPVAFLFRNYVQLIKFRLKVALSLMLSSN